MTRELNECIGRREEDRGSEVIRSNVSHGEKVPMGGGIDHGQIYGDGREGLRGSLGVGVLDMSGEADNGGVMQDSKKKLAKRANQIYRNVCNELDLNECFFYGFGAWSEFVDGKLSESGFYERAKAEAHDLATKQTG